MRLIALAFCFLTGSAYALDSATLSTMLSDLGSATAENNRLTGVLSDFTVDNERLMKENKVLADNRTLQQSNLTNATAAGQARLDSATAAKQAAINAVIAEYDRLGCVGSLPPEKYNWCMQQRATYTARIENMKTTGTQELRDLAAAIDRDTLAPIRSVIARQTAGIDQIAGKMKSNFNEFTRTQDTQVALRAKIASMRAAIADICSSARQGSATYSLCNGVNWDGTRTDLPPLTGPRKGTTVVPQ